jgi:cytochrome c-type biogenesis protein CcmH/NrfF
MNRRQFFGGVAGLLAVSPSLRQSQDTLTETGPAGKLWDPGRAGRPMQPTTAADNDAAIQAIEKQLKCTCGCGLDIYTCRTTDFTCPASPGLHRQVVAMAEAGMSGEAIVADFVRERGVELMAPPARGFNLTAYFLPGLAILSVGIALVFSIMRWARRRQPVAASVATADGTAPTAGELEQLRHELDRFRA